MKKWLIFLTPAYPKTLVYMLQSTEYNTRAYMQWWWRTKDFSKVATRRKLDLTRRTKILLIVLLLGLIVYFIGAIWAMTSDYVVVGIVMILSYPVVWAHLLIIPVLLARTLIVSPLALKKIKTSEKIFARQANKSAIIAVAGSYGKTSMKELLVTVLAANLKVAATPANYNVATSHARFAQTLEGDEDIVIIEYGEGAPGDVTKFIQTTHPTHAIITGLAPVHLDTYKTLDNAAEDIFSLTDAVPETHLYVNTESPYIANYVSSGLQQYNQKTALGWDIIGASVGLEGVEFEMQKGSVTMKLVSSLLGKHTIAPLACAAALAYNFGLSIPQITEAIAKTKPHEHRMQPYKLEGAWIIDDTYNGNIEGIRAGTQLLAELPAKRKVYVTPGLVDQGSETEQIHRELGRLISVAKPDIVVLMQNSVTGYIQIGLADEGYEGTVLVQDNPLDFYSNLSHFVAAGDVVMMQNDWTDNYH